MFFAVVLFNYVVKVFCLILSSMCRVLSMWGDMLGGCGIIVKKCVFPGNALTLPDFEPSTL